MLVEIVKVMDMITVLVMFAFDSKKGVVMTITDDKIIKIMLENDGTYPGDPQAHSIYRYHNTNNGRLHYAVFLNDLYNDMDTSPLVSNPQLLWTRNFGLTVAGRECLRGLKYE